MLTPNHGSADTADDYSDFVDNMIPKSRDLARLDAEMRERNRVFNGLAGEAQSHMTYATSFIAQLDYLSPRVYAGPTCHKAADGSIDISPTVTDLLISRQLLDAISAAKAHLAHFDTIKNGITHACDGDYSDYRVEHIDLDFLAPDIPTFDGTYILIPIYAEGFEVWGVVITFVESIVEIVHNSIQQQKIKDASQRYLARRATTDDYRTYAKNACASLQPDCPSSGFLRQPARQNKGGSGASVW
jgi:hypothetical protein